MIRILLAGARKGHICQRMVYKGYTKCYLYALLMDSYTNLKVMHFWKKLVMLK